MLSFVQLAGGAHRRGEAEVPLPPARLTGLAGAEGGLRWCRKESADPSTREILPGMRQGFRMRQGFKWLARSTLTEEGLRPV